MNEGFWYLVSAAAALAVGLMFCAWLLARRLGNAEVGDVAWALGFALVALVYLLLGQGEESRRLLMFGMVAIWSLRLGVSLWLGAARRRSGEMSHYAALREQYPRHAWLAFLGLFELQAVLLAVMSVPFALVSSNSAAGLSVWEWAGLGLWGVAMAGGLLVRRGRVFFEWLVWMAYFVFALGTPDGWIAVLCPMLVLVSLLDGTGIPGVVNTVRRPQFSS